jgi:hypothetical protein
MMSRTALPAVLLTLSFVGCQQSSPAVQRQSAAPLAPSPTLDAQSVERPYRASLTFTVYDVTFAPPGTLSTFDGRCSVPSALIMFANIAGVMAHAGRFEGTASHCNQPAVSPGAPSTYRDGLFTATVANGDILYGTYGPGTVRPDPGAPGRLLFDDVFAASGGTGRFHGASGAGTSHGEVTGDVPDVIAGRPVQFEQIGTITYAPGRGGH